MGQEQNKNSAQEEEKRRKAEERRREKERLQAEQAKVRSRANRWLAKTKSKVLHPKYGSVVIPHLSKCAAIENAAEFWKCDFSEIVSDAEVWVAEPKDGPVRRPKEFYGRDKQG